MLETGNVAETLDCLKMGVEIEIFVRLFSYDPIFQNRSGLPQDLSYSGIEA